MIEPTDKELNEIMKLEKDKENARRMRELKSLNSLVKPQPDSKPNENIHSWDVVIREYRLLQNHEYVEEIIQLMKDRDVFGTSKYRTHLQPFNGRDSLKDAIQEILDGLAYIQTAILENKDIDGILHGDMEKLYLILEDVYLIYLDNKDKKADNG